MNLSQYTIAETTQITSPALVYYKDIIKRNIDRAIEIAGNARRLWPHVKTHKMQQMVRMQIDAGITKFKCATIAEAEMLATTPVADVLVSYPLIGPNIDRFVKLSTTFPDVTCWAIGDNYDQLAILSNKAEQAGIRVPLLIDIDFGMHRTGFPLEGDVFGLYGMLSALKGLSVRGFHCYDGHHSDSDWKKRKERVDAADSRIFKIGQQLVSAGFKQPIYVMGGTPSFPCHAEYEHVYLSPGTAFVSDYGYLTKLPDLDFVPAAAVLTRVISRPGTNYFTIDLGYKGIASDPAGIRGIILGYEDAVVQFQSEEHWVFAMDDTNRLPNIGDVLYVVPTHICPTTALYQSVLVVENHKISGNWSVDARNRTLTI